LWTLKKKCTTSYFECSCRYGWQAHLDAVEHRKDLEKNELVVEHPEGRGDRADHEAEHAHEEEKEVMSLALLRPALKILGHEEGRHKEHLKPEDGVDDGHNLQGSCAQ
jgi:hypothetical protein